MCILLKVVTNYDLSTLSMSVMGFQPKNMDICELYSLGFFLTLQSP